MMQETIVAIIVIAAAAVIIARYAPNSLKRQLRSWSARSAARLGWLQLAAKIERQTQAAADCATGCGKCGSNGATRAAKTQTISPEALKQTIRRPD